MASDELRLRIGVPENYRSAALHQLRCPKGPFTRDRPLRTEVSWSGTGIFIKEKAN